MSVPDLRLTEDDRHRRNFAGQPRLRFDPAASDGSHRTVSVLCLNNNLLRSARRGGDALISRALRVRVIDGQPVVRDDVPGVIGRYQLLDDRIQFAPSFPFAPGLRYRAIFDGKLLGGSALGTPMVLEFSFAADDDAQPPSVTNIFPSGDVLPENILRFYVWFSAPMQRGAAHAAVTLLDANAEQLDDVLYRAPAELWDRDMRRLTVLIDPGRLKRGVGPNRALGPPIREGAAYVLRIGNQMSDAHGKTLAGPVTKYFHTAAAVRDHVVTKRWTISEPAVGTREALTVEFGRSLDRALLEGAIGLECEAKQAVAGAAMIERGETQWSFTPASAWTAGAYRLRIGTAIEDVCGNDLAGAFDRQIAANGPHAGPIQVPDIRFQLR